MWRKWSVIPTGYLLVKDYQYISKNATSLLGLTLREDIDKSHGILEMEDSKGSQSEEKFKKNSSDRQISKYFYSVNPLTEVGDTIQHPP